MGQIQTLHAHTTSSDGKLTYFEMLEVARRNGIAVVAFTDHDAVIPVGVVNRLRGQESSVNWVSGVEISSGLPREVGGGPSSGFHIVGLFVDPTNSDLQNHCRNAQEARRVRMRKMVKNLRELGFDISEDDCLSVSSGEAITRPHVVQAIKSKPNNVRILEKLRLQMKQAARKDPQVKMKYDLMMERGEDQYPYVLFLGSESHIPNVYVDYQYYTEMDETVRLIRAAGGLAIVAHYYTVEKKIPPKLLGQFFEEDRLDGVETVFGLWGYGTEAENRIDEARNLARKLSRKYRKVPSGGADAHDGADLAAFAQAEWYSGETVGMAERIIRETAVNTEWSSF